MFRKTQTNTIPDLFTSFTQNLDGVRQKKFSDPNGWHNLFREQIVARIDEEPFRVLYSKDTQSRPNASIRVLLGMMILKEGFGWSDERLFEEAQFDILVMNGLGFTNIDDSVLSIATYYNFRRSLYEHQVKTGENLVDHVFKQLTKEQAKFFGVNGKIARMDSKLIGSNICKSSRLQLVINVLQEFYKDIRDNLPLVERLAEEDRKTMEWLMKKKAGNHLYEMDNEQREKTLEDLGYLLYRLQGLYNETESSKYHLLVRVLSEQYKIEGGKAIIRDVKEIGSDSLQSPYDEDAAYRKKGEQKIRGYSINVTETCDTDSLNLITDVQTEKANYSDNAYLQGAIERSEEIVGHIENVHADGAYHSPENQEFAKENQMELILGNIQGKEGKYEFKTEGNKCVEVVNKETGETHRAEEYKEGKYKFTENGKLKYFVWAWVLSCLQRQQIKSIPREILNRRNNVEAAMFQLSFFTRKNNSRYRGLFKHRWWANCRCMWLNLIRIKNWVGEVCPDGNKPYKNEGILTKTEELATTFSLACKKEINFLAQIFHFIVFGKEFSSQRVTPVELGGVSTNTKNWFL